MAAVSLCGCVWPAGGPGASQPNSKPLFWPPGLLSSPWRPPCSQERGRGEGLRQEEQPLLPLHPQVSSERVWKQPWTATSAWFCCPAGAHVEQATSQPPSWPLKVLPCPRWPSYSGARDRLQGPRQERRLRPAVPPHLCSEKRPRTSSCAGFCCPAGARVVKAASQPLFPLLSVRPCRRQPPCSEAQDRGQSLGQERRSHPPWPLQLCPERASKRPRTATSATSQPLF